MHTPAPQPEHRDNFDYEIVQDAARAMCIICQALYVPAPTHSALLQAPPAILESAFMSMCHFCFRCRRPACPSCWDDMHGVCGDCALETDLPFRSPVLPLPDARLAMNRRAQVTRVLSLATPLLCVKPGRFQLNAMLIETASTVYLPALTSNAQPHPRLVEPDDFDLAEMATRPPLNFTDEADIGEVKTVARQPRRIMPLRLLGQLLVTLLVIGAGGIIGLTGAALISSEVNTYLTGLLAIDIRATLSQLWNMLLNGTE